MRVAVCKKEPGDAIENLAEGVAACEIGGGRPQEGSRADPAGLRGAGRRALGSPDDRIRGQSPKQALGPPRFCAKSPRTGAGFREWKECSGKGVAPVRKRFDFALREGYLLLRTKAGERVRCRPSVLSTNCSRVRARRGA